LKTRHHAIRAAATFAALAGLLAAVPAAAQALVEIGTAVEDVKLESLAGGKQALLGKADVHILLFFRPGQERSSEVLKELAACEKTLATKPVRVVGIIPSTAVKEEAAAAIKESGIATMTVLVDEGDELYGRWQVRQHPISIVVGKDRKVSAVQPYTRLRYCDVLMAQVQFALKEIDAEQLALVLDPPKAMMPSDDKTLVALRRVNLGEKYLAKGNCGLALQQFEEALKLDPASARAAEGKKKCEATGAVAAPAAPATAPQAAAQ
jgi:hypothetical protein